ncbi:MAG: hypothetical protein ACRDF4_01175 [Rhabdochlamydiaceae bacterium]
MFILELYLIMIILKSVARFKFMKKWWWVFVLLFSALHADADSAACKQEIQKIDMEIQQLQAQKQKHVDLAKQYQTEGDRWKYTTGRIDDAHTAWGNADNERAKAIDLQRQIDLLYEKKNRIYQFYPQLQYE